MKPLIAYYKCNSSNWPRTLSGACVGPRKEWSVDYQGWRKQKVRLIFPEMDKVGASVGKRLELVGELAVAHLKRPLRQMGCMRPAYDIWGYRDQSLTEGVNVLHGYHMESTAGGPFKKQQDAYLILGLKFKPNIFIAVKNCSKKSHES